MKGQLCPSCGFAFGHAASCATGKRGPYDDDVTTYLFCPTCEAQEGQPCCTPGPKGRAKDKPHGSRTFSVNIDPTIFEPRQPSRQDLATLRSLLESMGESEETIKGVLRHAEGKER